MTCASVRKLLPLHAGGDLDETRQRAVEAHLRACAACAAVAAGYRETREWTRSAAPLPFTTGDYDRIRRGVWDRIDTEPPQAAWRERLGRFFEARLALAGRWFL
jgi:anti-sigma factor RsiW